MGRLASRVLVGGMPKREADKSLKQLKKLLEQPLASAASAPSTSSRTISAAGSHVVDERRRLAGERDVLVGAVLAQRGQQLRADGRRVDRLRVLAEAVDQRRPQRARVGRPAGPVVGRQHALGVRDLDGVERARPRRSAASTPR